MPIGNVIFKNFVTKIKPEKKKKTRKQHTHVIFNDEVGILSYAENCIPLSNLFFFKVQVIVTFTNKTFIHYKVERS